MRYSLLAPAILASAVHAWLPMDRDLAAFNQTHRFAELGKRWQPSLPSGTTKIRGVNFGSWLICEKWLMTDEWVNTMGCGDSASEFDCMNDHYTGDNRDAGNAAFEKHWSTWITPDDVQKVYDVGLNTIRIPIGYWSYTEIVDTASEPFADGNLMLPYLDAVVQKAADLGIYVIIDLHGAPGGQQQDVFTGQNPNPAGFFNDYDYGRAEQWLTWMTNRIHNTPAYSTVGMIEVLNEPVSGHDADGRYPAPGEETLVSSYYGGALAAVRNAESALGVSSDKALTVQFMSEKWDSGNPRDNSAVASDGATGYDDHNYIGFAVSNNGDQTALMQSACQDSRVVSGQDFTITGEWSMTSSVDWSDQTFFHSFFTAQQQLYEKPGMAGWVYWTWKSALSDPRWDYQYATGLSGYVPTDAAGLEGNVYNDVCAGFT
ncbi:glycoside hydrolase family 5 protein [Xylariaceae sp. FL1272]|nr:glycoside hydrolase family 5 protein [Xylariaceae sp. FL1272]